jgi:CDP-6-deoxy-D-xylo-4-hexulose-3-dehydrase
VTPEDRASLERIVRAALADVPMVAHDAASGHPLTVTGFGAEEALGAIDALLSTHVTMGARTRAFEAAWAAYCGRAHGVMVNSGSSANLLMLAALVETGMLAPGDEVLVPAVGWSTTLFPVAQAGLVPVVVDVDEATLCIDPAAAARARTSRTRAVLAVHLLGQPAALDDAAFDGLVRLEDACAAHGARAGQRRVGGIGHAASFSFFFSHHITTIEGGIVVTDDGALADALRSLRAHGWIRERSDRQALADAHPEIDPRFLFVSVGYNLRPTELQAAFGLAQLPRLEAWVEARRRNHEEWVAAFRDVPGVRVYPEAPDTAHAGFAFPMLVEDLRPGARASLSAHLERQGIETRPISGSNLARQPAFRHVPARVPHPLPVADAVHARGLFVGNSHAFGRAHGERLAAAVAAWRNT